MAFLLNHVQGLIGLAICVSAALWMVKRPPEITGRQRTGGTGQ
jgi:hypothetical protein